MIGLIITGHGNFATGIDTSVQVIAGKQENYELVDFPIDATLDDLKANLTAALDKLSHLDGILVLADLVGGSPFKTAVEMSVGRDNVAIVGGVSLAAILEMSMMRSFAEDVFSLADSSVDCVKNNVLKYEFVKKQVVNDEDGI